jgi:3-oxoacyl-[acyl-carrier-protein] synthase II
MGAVTPVGLTARETWESAVAGQSGIDFIGAFDASGFPVRIAAEVKGFDPDGLAPAKELRRMERYVQLSLAAANEAVAEAALDGAYDPMRVGILFGSAIGGFPGVIEQADVFRERGVDRVSPYFIPSVLVDTASGQLAITLGFKGRTTRRCRRARPGRRRWGRRPSSYVVGTRMPCSPAAPSRASTR